MRLSQAADGRITKVKRASAFRLCLYQMALVVAVLSCSGAQPGSTLASNSIVVESVRPPDTTDTRGPYEIILRQVAGPPLMGASLMYRITGLESQSESKSALRWRSEDAAWVGHIPPAPTGSLIDYHFVLTAKGAEVRHPRRDGPVYQFAVVPAKLLSVDTGDAISLSVEANAPPAAEASVRLIRAAGAIEERVRPVECEKVAVNRFSCVFAWPALSAGEAVEVSFRISASNGFRIRAPLNGSYYRRAASHKVFPLASSVSPVLGTSGSDGDRWFALRGGGIWNESPRGLRRWTLSDGLPSNVARFILREPATGRMWAGTDRGVAAIEQFHSAGSFVAMGEPWRAGPGAVSPLDGAVFFQLQRPGHDATSFWEVRNGELRQWRPPSRIGLRGLSSLSFDAMDGCWLMGAFVQGPDAPLPAVIQRCGDEFLVTAIPNATRIVAVARDPATGQMAAAIEVKSAEAEPGFAVQLLTSNAQPLAVPTEITGLVADWSNRRLLVATFGEGLQSLDGSELRPVGNGQLPVNITTLSPGLVVGSAGSAFVLGPRDRVQRVFAPASLNLPPDALPMDAGPDGRVLFSSYSSGLIEMQADGSSVLRLWRRGRELPDGLFGDAAYKADGFPWAIVLSQGLWHATRDGSQSIGVANGLSSSELLRLLVLKSGDVWVAHAPSPSNLGTPPAGVQVWDGKRFSADIPINDRQAATVGRWFEVPERNSVFAATGIGVVEITGGGLRRLSGNATSTIARAGDVIGAAGATVEKWDGSRFTPVLFALRHPKWQISKVSAGAVVDMAIDNHGRWYLLFAEGVLAILDAAGQFEELLTVEDGVPPTARRVLAHPETGNVFVGSSTDGVVVIRWRR